MWLASKCTMLTILDILLGIGLIASDSSLNSIQVSGIDLEAPTGLLSQCTWLCQALSAREETASKRTTRHPSIVHSRHMCDDFCREKAHLDGGQRTLYW